jgi:glycosyltransferase involved in cell wall biosynthesis
MKDSIVYLRHWGSHFKSLRHVENVTAELGSTVRRGWRCVLVLERLPEDPSWISCLRTAGIELQQVPRPSKSLDWAVVRQVRSLCRQLGINVMACDNMHTSPLLGAALARVPVRLWFDHNMSLHYEEVRTPTLRERLAPSLRLSCQLATRVLAVSQAVKDELVQLGIPTHKVLVRTNPRQLGSGVGALDRSAARALWGFAESDVVIGSIGRGTPVKGWDILVDAFIRVAPADPHARLLLVGSFTADYEEGFVEDLRRRLRAHNLEARVVFAGYVGQVLTALRAMDIFAQPSRSEACSYALIEAIEARLPCVAARVGAAHELICDDVNGFLVERCQPAEFARSLLRLTQDSAFRDHCRVNSTLPSSILTAEEYGTRFALDCEGMLAGSV